MKKNNKGVLSIITDNEGTTFIPACFSIQDRVDCDDAVQVFFIFQNWQTAAQFIFSQQYVSMKI